MNNLAIDRAIRKNFIKRTITGILLIIYMSIVIYYGAPFIFFNALLIQLKCFDEVIQIAYKIKKIPDIPYFRKINWYLLFTANYFFAGDIFSRHMEAYHEKYKFLNFLNRYHQFISFCFYLLGMLWFVTLMKKKLMRKQFSLLFWTHFLLIIIVWQSYMAIHNLFEGIIWVMLPLGLVILNDVFSYAFGRICGKTPLIRLSPNKTWEGFLLGGICTVIFGTILAYLFSNMHFLICPIEYKNVNDEILLNTDCTPNYVFQLQEYKIGDTGYSIFTYPLFIHTFALSFFASIIAPFGGFFASGFKRAAGVKDFGDLIPGHGGLMDRFDCQFLMATFANVYIRTFIQCSSVEKVFQKILLLNNEKQLEVFQLMKDSFEDRQLEYELNGGFDENIH